MKIVKMADMPVDVALEAFRRINVSNTWKEKVKIKKNGYKFSIITNTEPKDLRYPEGWYYAKGCFRNKHTSTTGMYSEVRMENSRGEPWENIARYSTLNMSE